MFYFYLFVFVVSGLAAIFFILRSTVGSYQKLAVGVGNSRQHLRLEVTIVAALFAPVIVRGVVWTAALKQLETVSDTSQFQ